jgi:hypothetical protein
MYGLKRVRRQALQSSEGSCTPLDQATVNPMARDVHNYVSLHVQKIEDVWCNLIVGRPYGTSANAPLMPRAVIVRVVSLSMIVDVG